MRKIICLFLLLILFPAICSAELQAHFLDVGSADCCIIICDDEAMIIDGGNANDSSLVYSYLKNTLKIDRIKCVIVTHPHEDHIGGLSGALIACKVDNVFSSHSNYKSDEFENLKKYTENQRKTIRKPYSGYSLILGDASVKIISPKYTYKNINDMSLIVHVKYGDTSFLFMGDAEKEAENDFINSFDLKADLIKIGHHGKDTSTSEELLKKIEPEIAIISCGSKETEQPSKNVISRLEKFGCEIHLTAGNGHIIAVSDGKTITVSSDVLKKDKQNGETYVLNTNTKKYHYPSCNSAKTIKDKNKKVLTSTTDQLKSQGYMPCGICKP